MIKKMKTQAQHLQAGMVLADSGFIVTRNAYADDSTPFGWVRIESHYTGDVLTMNERKYRSVVSVVVD